MIRKPFLIKDFATVPVWISLYMRNISFSFLTVSNLGFFLWQLHGPDIDIFISHRVATSLCIKVIWIKVWLPPAHLHRGIEAIYHALGKTEQEQETPWKKGKDKYTTKCFCYFYFCIVQCTVTPDKSSEKVKKKHGEFFLYSVFLRSLRATVGTISKGNALHFCRFRANFSNCKLCQKF